MKILRTSFYALCCYLFTANFAQAAEIPDFPFVVSKGQAEKDVSPDMATVHISLLSFDKESGASLDALSLASKDVLAVLKKYNISKDKLEASDIRKNTQRARDRNYNLGEVIGYETSRSMKLKLDSLKDYPNIMSDLIAINNLSEVNSEFDTKNRDKFEKELMREAGKIARSEATLMAEGLGSKIQSVFAISQDANFISFFANFSPSARHMEMAADKSGGGREFLMLPPETITLEKNINVIFKLAP